MSLAILLFLVACGYGFGFAARIQVVLTAPVDTTRHEWTVGIAGLATGSDSVFCDGRLLQRGAEYSFNARTGTLILDTAISCDSILFSALQLPDWFLSQAGNPAPTGRRLLHLESISRALPQPTASRPQKVTFSGSKSFSLAVGRAGEGRFAQGLNLDFDATVAADLRMRGSISDRGTSGTGATGGGTTLLSELDKYFFEIEGSRLAARGGDIVTAGAMGLSPKRIKGMATTYAAENWSAAANIGRPPGQFISQVLRGADGRQGPYQVTDNAGLPTAVVPGSEKIYLDGRLLESGADKEYVIDYAAGRITFSPRALITARSRMEVDCEAAATAYQQVLYDMSGIVGFFGKKASFGVGARRENDEKDRMRLASLSTQDIAVLSNAGDSSSLAMRDGASLLSGGPYDLLVDSLGRQYYRYVGSGAGHYAVTFSAVGEGKGDYRYLGEGVYEFIGNGLGNYMPLRFLPLPSRHDLLYSTLTAALSSTSTMRLDYQGEGFDRNLYSARDDGDNFKSRIDGSFAYIGSRLTSGWSVRYRQAGFGALVRQDTADYLRVWALPQRRPAADELRFEGRGELKSGPARAEMSWGHLSYKDALGSSRFAVSTRIGDNWPVTPSGEYHSAVSKGTIVLPGKGFSERAGVGVSLKALRPVRLDLGWERELVKDLYAATSSVEKYTEYRSTLFFRRSVMTLSRRIDYSSGRLGYKGPQLDKIGLTMDETLGRLTVSFSGTYLNMKRLDSDREDRIERLYYASFHYAPAGGWLTVRADYRQNNQNIRSFGYRYIQVADGEGEYRWENGQYLFDLNGDYLRIREETGGENAVSTGEKSHTVLLYPGRLGVPGMWRRILNQTAFHLRTEIIEAMPGEKGRRASWLWPWASRAGIDYLSRTRRERYAAMLFPRSNFYILNMTYTGLGEEQNLGVYLNRNRKEYEIEIKNQLTPKARSSLHWHHTRTFERGTGLVAARFRSHELQGTLTVATGHIQWSPRVGYVRMRDLLSGGEGDGVTVGQQLIWRQPGRGEIRSEVEGRSLTENRRFSQPEFLVTDGRRFGKSARVTVSGDYEIGRNWRLTLNLTDELFEKRPAELAGRGELIARF